MKKIIGLILITLLLAACSGGPVQGFFIDLRQYREYSSAEVSFTCTDSPSYNIVKSFDLRATAWVIQIDDLKNQLARECDAAIFPPAITELPGVDFDDVVGATMKYVTLYGGPDSPIAVVPRPVGVADAEGTTFFYSRGNGGGNFLVENPGETQIDHIRIGKGWGIYTYVPYRDLAMELKLVDLNGIEWVFSSYR